MELAKEARKLMSMWCKKPQITTFRDCFQHWGLPFDTASDATERQRQNIFCWTTQSRGNQCSLLSKTRSLLAEHLKTQRRISEKSQKIAFQVPFSVYVNVTGSGKGKQSVGDGGTVASGASGSSKGTKATAVSEASNVSGVKLRYIILVHTCISCRFCFRFC